MSKTLEERLRAAKEALGKVDAAITLHPAKLPADVVKQFRKLAAFASNVEHWNQMLAARQVARTLLTDLEQADGDDNVQYGTSRVKFQTARLLGVQSYLAAQWALADGLVAMAGHVLCIPDSLYDPKKPPQLVSHFVGGKGPEERVAAIAFRSLRDSFGWPIAISYALRNHFLHDGGGGVFFDGPTAASSFKISVDGWARVEERVKSYSVTATHSRTPGAWTPAAGDDLRKVLDTCAPELDEALGILLGSACEMAKVHVGFMVGED